MKTIFKKKAIVCDTHTSDSMEFLMLATAAKLPEDLTCHPKVKWMQVVHSVFNPVEKHYMTASGKRRVKKFIDYIAVRIEAKPSHSELHCAQWKILSNYIDTWYGDAPGISTWYFSIPPV
jgi:hypothetical protein